MKNALDFINKWLGEITEILKSLIMVGVVVGILYGDTFGVIAGISRVASQFGDGFEGLLALMIVYMWYQKK